MCIIRQKLKPCPFCGGKAKICRNWNYVWDYGFIKCDTCGATTGKFDYYKSAIKAWNRRAALTFTPDELDAIRKALEEYSPKSRKQWERGLSIIEKCTKALKGGKEC